MKKIIVHLIFCVAFIALQAIVSSGQVTENIISPSQVQEEKEKIIRWASFRAPSASAFETLEIVDVKAGDKTVTIGQVFSAGDDWLKSLTFRVKNISSKPIIDLTIGITFPETEENYRGTGTNISSPEIKNNLLSNAPKILMPGEEIDVMFTDAGYRRFMGSLVKSKPNINLTKLDITQTLTVKYDDGTSCFCSFRLNRP